MIFHICFTSKLYIFIFSRLDVEMSYAENKENMLSFHLQHFAKKNKPLSPFVSKLRFLLNSTKYHHAISWSVDGRAIIITDIDTFKRSVLDNEEEMFKTRNFTSFVRQLNLYGFRKVPSNGKSDPMSNMKFEHVHFRRERPDLMYLVHRTCLGGKRRIDTLSSGLLRGKKVLMSNSFDLRNTKDNGYKKPTTQVRLNIPCKFSQVPKFSRTPLGVSVLQNLKRKHEQNFTIVHETASINHTLDDSLTSSLDSSINERDIDIHGSNSHDEHDYALPVHESNHCNEIDEKATFNFLNQTFNNEIEVVRGLLSLKDVKPKHDTNLDGLTTLAEVSFQLSNTPLLLETNYNIRSQSMATPRETLQSS